MEIKYIEFYHYLANITIATYENTTMIDRKRFSLFCSDDATEFEEFASYAIIILLAMAIIAGVSPWVVFLLNFTTF